MKQIKKDKNDGKVISFKRNSDFYLRRGTNAFDNGDIPEAIFNYKRGLRLDYKNKKCALALAEVLTSINKFYESNAVLLIYCEKDKDNGEELFGLGCNFFGLEQAQNAITNLKKYVDKNPNGKYVPEALDMLDFLDDMEYEDISADNGVEHTKKAKYDGKVVEFGFDKKMKAKANAAEQQKETKKVNISSIAKATNSDIQEILEKAQYLISDGRINDAIEMLLIASDRYDVTIFKDTLAFIEYNNGNYENALKYASSAIKDDAFDITAHCNALLCYYKLNFKDKLEKQLKKLDEMAKNAYIGDKNKIAIAFADVKEFTRARNIVYSMLDEVPYESAFLHTAGICNFELGNYEDALECYDVILKMDEFDSIARYYRNICRDALEGNKRKIIEDGMSIMNYQVPYTEIVSRLNRIASFDLNSHDELVDKWNESDEFETLMRWSLTLQDTGIRQAAFELLCDIGDKRAEIILREVLLNPEYDSEIKNSIFPLLKKMDADEPYLALIADQIVEGKVSKFDFDMEKLNPMLKKAIDISIGNLQENEQLNKSPEEMKNAVTFAMDLWVAFSARVDIDDLDIKNWLACTAAVELISIEYATKQYCVKQAMCKKYEITLYMLNKWLDFFEFLKEI